MVLMSAQNYLLFQAGQELLSELLVLILRILLDSFVDVGKLQANWSEVHNFLADEHLPCHFFNFASQCRCDNLGAKADS